MLKLEEIKELITLIDESSITEFKYEVDGSVVKLKKQAEVVQVNSVQEVATAAPVIEQQRQATTEPIKSEAIDPVQQENTTDILSPMVGTFYSKPSPDTDSYVSVGSTVSENTVVCIVEAMKLFNEIEAEIDGDIVEILVEDGQLVEFGQPLFKVKAK